MKHGIPTSPLSPILQPSEPANSMTKRPSFVRFAKTPYLTAEDLYLKFHEKHKPSSLSAKQNRLPSTSSSGQMRIIIFKNFVNEKRCMSAGNDQMKQRNLIANAKNFLSLFLVKS